MSERSRRMRRQISDVTEESSEDSDSGSGAEYDPRRADAARRAGRFELPPITGRAKRGIAATVSSTRTSSASIQRASPGAVDDKRQSLKLTVKAAPSKLREVMRANEVDSLHDTLGGGQVLNGPRSRRSAATSRTSARTSDARPKYAEYAESDIEDEEDEEEEDEEEEEEAEEINDFDELGAEAEGGTDEEVDVDMEDEIITTKRQPAPKPPKITLKPPSKSEAKQGIKSKLVVTPANVGPLQSVEDKEMEDDPGDEEVDESEEEDEDDEEEDETNLNDEDAEGEEEIEEDILQVEDQDMMEDDEDDEDDDDDDDDDTDETPESGAATPDINRLTKRQRGRPEDQGGLMALDMAPQQRKFFTDAEKAMKKDEHARKRKELTKRRVQEEKTAALNRLLKPQASKARGATLKPENLAAAAAALSGDDEEYVEKANPLYTRWVSTKDGMKLGVPEEWLGKRAGTLFGSPVPPSNGALIQEIP